MERPRRPRWLIASIAALIAVSSLAGAASSVVAGDTRIVFIGTTTNGLLALTQPVSTGGISMTSIVVRNDGKQNLNKATLSIGVLPAAALPAGATVEAVMGADAAACAIASDARSMVCDYGSLPSKAVRSITLLFGFADPLAGAVVQASVRVNENVNDHGANQDTFFAVDTIDVSATSCDNIATFVPPGQAKAIGTGLEGCTDQSTALAIPGTGNGHVVRVAEEDSPACAFGLSCFGRRSVGQVDGGAAVSPYLEWTITWPSADIGRINLNKAGVIHFLDNGTPIRIDNSKKSACKGTGVDCIVSFGFSADGNWLIAVVRTATNGSMKGFG